MAWDWKNTDDELPYIPKGKSSIQIMVWSKRHGVKQVIVDRYSLAYKKPEANCNGKGVQFKKWCYIDLPEE